MFLYLVSIYFSCNSWHVLQVQEMEQLKVSMVTQMWSLQLSILSGVSASFNHPKPMMFTAFILLILKDSTEITHKSCIKLGQMYELFVGKTNRNNVQAVYSGGKLASFSTVVIGCGLFSDLIYHTERQRWLKKARYVGEI